MLSIRFRKAGYSVIASFKAPDPFMSFLRKATWSAEDKPITIHTKYGDCFIHATGRGYYELTGVWPTGSDVLSAASYVQQAELDYMKDSEELFKRMQLIYGELPKEAPKAQPTTSEFLPTRIKGTLHLPQKPADVSRVTELAQRLNNKFGHTPNSKKHPSNEGGVSC